MMLKTELRFPFGNNKFLLFTRYIIMHACYVYILRSHILITLQMLSEINVSNLMNDCNKINS